MRLRCCSEERAVIAAIRAGDWTPSLREHAATCSVCTEVILVEAELNRDAAVSNEQMRLPPAELIWLRSRLLAQQSALNPIHGVERWAFRFAVASAALVVAGLFGAVARAL
jgi:hypothetical protein